MNKEKLRERCYEMGNSQLPLDVFFNDITQNTNPRFNKLLAYCDLEKIVNHIENLKKENQELKNTILSLELDTCIPELRKENTKLKNVIKILKRNYLAVEKNRNSDTGYIVSIESDITQQEYESIKEVLENE